MAVLLPTAAWANPAPPFEPQNLHWVLLGEVGVVILETAMLRRLFALDYWDALRPAATVNLVSFFVGLIATGMWLLPAHIPHALLEILADVRYAGSSWATVDLTLTELGQGYFLLLGVLTLLVLLFETPLYSALLRPQGKQPAVVKLLLVNLVSYPLFYSMLFGAEYLQERFNRPI